MAIDPRINQLSQEIIRLLEHLRREVEETRAYADRNDYGTALRNQNDSNDELQLLVNRWRDLIKAIENKK